MPSRSSPRTWKAPAIEKKNNFCRLSLKIPFLFIFFVNKCSFRKHLHVSFENSEIGQTATNLNEISPSRL